MHPSVLLLPFVASFPWRASLGAVVPMAYMYLKHIIIPYPLRESFKSPVPHILRKSFKSPVPPILRESFKSRIPHILRDNFKSSANDHKTSREDIQFSVLCAET